MDQVEWMERYRRKLARQRVPISVTLELTRQCNLRCVHCYLGSDDVQRDLGADEMTTDQVKGVLDELVAAGCLYLLITGGDPMMRKDFAEIYLYARERGLVVTVFCDGVLVSEDVIDLFRRYPPQFVEISLYGATESTYERVTRVKGSFRRCLGGVRKLLDAGVRVALKTVLMTVNLHELDDMRAVAEDLGLPFHMDSAIFPCLSDGDHGPLDLRVDPEVAVAKELADEEARRRWRTYMNDRAESPPSDRLYVCGAGVTSLFIDAAGWASPCLIATHEKYNLLERGLEALWNDELKRVQHRKASEHSACVSCEMRTACTACPAFNFLETGAEEDRSDYLCATAVARWSMLTGKNGSGLPVMGHVPVDGD